MSTPSRFWRWLSSSQNWFARTERSSGFRALLIFFILHFVFVIVANEALGPANAATVLLTQMLWITIPGFMLLYVAMAFVNPNFCRSEKHVENLQRLQYAQQSNEPEPKLIESAGRPSLGAKLGDKSAQK